MTPPSCEGGRKGGREGGKEGGREGGLESGVCLICGGIESGKQQKEGGRKGGREGGRVTCAFLREYLYHR